MTVAQLAAHTVCKKHRSNIAIHGKSEETLFMEQYYQQ